MKKGPRILLIVLASLVVIVAVGAVAASGMVKGLESFLADVVIEPVDLNAVADGTYKGRTDAGIIQVRLEADVRDHRITDIQLLKHRNGQGAAAEGLIPRIIEEQRIDLDTVSGATYSSLAILDAVEEALTKEGKK